MASSSGACTSSDTTVQTKSAKRNAMAPISVVLAYVLCTFPVLSISEGNILSGVSTLSASPIISTIAGTGETRRSDDGISAISASIFSPYSVSLDKKGNIYIAEYGADVIRKIDTNTGDLTTVAGTGMAGRGPEDIAATDCDLYGPTSISFDTAGNMFIAEISNHLIRKVDAMTGTISTIAGVGNEGFSGNGGLATSAELNSPSSVVVDKLGNVYIADTGNNWIRKVDGTTRYITLFADGSSPSGLYGEYAIFFRPSCVTIDALQNIYIADQENHCVRKVASVTGEVSTVAGVCSNSGFSGDSGLANKAKMHSPSSVVVDSVGNVYIADNGNYRIRMVNATTKAISTIAGTGAGAYNGNNIPALTAAISPLGLAVTTLGNIYFADKDAGRVRIVLMKAPLSAAPSAAPSSTISAIPSSGTKNASSTSPSSKSLSSSPSSSPSFTKSPTPSSPRNASSLSPSSTVITSPSSQSLSSAPSALLSSKLSASPSSGLIDVSSPSSLLSASPSLAPSPSSSSPSPSSSPSSSSSSSSSASASNSATPSSPSTLLLSSIPTFNVGDAASSAPSSSGTKSNENAAAVASAGHSLRDNAYFCTNVIVSVVIGVVAQYWLL